MADVINVRRSRFALPIICLAQLMATLDVTIVNLALPAIQHNLNLSNAGLAWVIDAYTLGYAGLLLVGGRTGDLIGYRRTLAMGISIFTASSLLGGMAQSPTVLLAARAGQGIGAAMATPTTLALISTLFPAGPSKSRAMVAYGAMAGLGITLGLVLGGVLTQIGNWHWVFLVNVPIGLGLLVVAPKVLPESRGVRRRIDFAGAAVGTAAITSLVYGVIRAGTNGWGDRISITALVVAATLMVTFARVEKAAPEPMLPPQLLRNRTRLSAYIIAGLLFACLYPAFFFLSRTVQDVMGEGPIQCGVRFLPLGAGVLIFAVIARRLLVTMGPTPLVIAGTVATGVATVALVFLKPETPYVYLFLPGVIGLGAGVGTTFVANTVMAMNDVAEQDAGIGSGLLSTFQAVGGTIGVAALASIAATRTRNALHAGVSQHDALMEGFTRGLAIAATLALLAVLVALIPQPDMRNQKRTAVL
ncbi:MFS transporter [Mycobacterium simiae]|uniref:MFS transporter n=1 Tax=Mycobacterium simiae TaxID=1784 RepID=UPI0004192C85|nr:MFS transporter [Mycobacterium simiae]BBX43204.1 MFS transporter [Mycobacterium simiae]